MNYNGIEVESAEHLESLMIDLEDSQKEFVMNEYLGITQTFIESAEQKLQKNKAFGNQLLDVFLVDNMNMQIAFTTELSIAMMQRFSPIEFLARNGDIKNVRLLIMGSTIDSVFTQERKDKYVLMCSNYLGL